MNANELLEMIKKCIRSYMDTYGYKINDMTDSKAIARLGAGCTTLALKIEFEQCTGGGVKTARLRAALDYVHSQGLLLKLPAIGHMNTYWPVGFADELRIAA